MLEFRVLFVNLLYLFCRCRKINAFWLLVFLRWFALRPEDLGRGFEGPRQAHGWH